MRLTTITNTAAGLIATNGKLYFAKRHDRPAPWQIFITLPRAQAWLERAPQPVTVRWN